MFVADALSILGHLVTGMLGHFVDSARGEITSVLDRYLYSTVDTTVPGSYPLTANPTLRQLNGGLVLAVDVMVAAVIVFSSLRAVFEHRSFRSQYNLKVVVPKLFLAVALAHGSMLFIQMLIDLNNALSHVAITLGDANGSQDAPWVGPISEPVVHRLQLTQDLFHSVFAVVLVVALVLLTIAYVIRTALLNVLIVTAPIAALLTVLPDTRNYARGWLRLFLVTVFMQAIQLIVLRVAVTTGFDHNGGLVETLYALATLFLMLKVPGALNTASHMETKAHTALHHVERSLHRMVAPHHATRSRA